MNVGVAHSEQNPNTTWLNSKGIWFTYIIFTAIMHLILLSLPFLTTATAWTLTNVFHNLVCFILFLFIYLGQNQFITWIMKYNNIWKIYFLKGGFLFTTHSERSTMGEFGSGQSKIIYILGTNWWWCSVYCN